MPSRIPTPTLDMRRNQAQEHEEWIGNRLQIRVAFERAWKHRLTLAETFLEKLKEKGLHGVREVEALVEHMKEEFDTATWNTRTLFPHAHKERTVRVSLGQFQKAPTPLSREVLPEDIPEPFKVIGSDHPDYKYDWDYVASTDPIHPIDTNYAHPLDAVDPSWVLHHLSPEDLEQSSDGFGFDTSEADTIWGSSLEGVNVESTVWVEDASGWTSEAAGFGQSQAPGDPVHAAAPEPQIEGYAEDDNLLSERVDMMIRYNRELLCLSRWEIKDAEGPNGRFVIDPQLPRHGDAKNGWLK
ncbi:hypothetical protein N0V87_004059 [Didymella glomerata]|uniref:Uncharacterized protein n=1 Tax=Didymella glomerata TaxID=749621 RepID=A0A9W9C143_9PLEO|nr:hypothetical protein N0V87_004059 [Didymella glomerata]